MAEHNKIGKIGEEHAATFLQNQGYTILARNFRCNRNEIDLIAKQHNTLVFVEVKTRTTSFWEKPEEAVSMTQQASIIQAANGYMEKNNCSEEVRFDIISIVLSENSFPEISHLIAAFHPSWG